MYINKKRRQDAYSRYYFSFKDISILYKLIKSLRAKILSGVLKLFRISMKLSMFHSGSVISNTWYNAY